MMNFLNMSNFLISVLLFILVAIIFLSFIGCLFISFHNFLKHLSDD